MSSNSLLYKFEFYFAFKQIGIKMCEQTWRISIEWKKKLDLYHSLNAIFLPIISEFISMIKKKKKIESLFLLCDFFTLSCVATNIRKEWSPLKMRIYYSILFLLLNITYFVSFFFFFFKFRTTKVFWILFLLWKAKIWRISQKLHFRWLFTFH